jgi:hypothetical protein
MAVSVVRQPCTVCVLNTLLAVPIQLDRWYVRFSEMEGSLVETSASGQPRCFAFWQEFSKVSLPPLVYSAPLVLICLSRNSATPMRTSRVTAVHSRTTTWSVYTTPRRCVSHPVFPDKHSTYSCLSFTFVHSLWHPPIMSSTATLHHSASRAMLVLSPTVLHSCASPGRLPERRPSRPSSFARRSMLPRKGARRLISLRRVLSLASALSNGTRAHRCRCVHWFSRRGRLLLWCSSYCNVVRQSRWFHCSCACVNGAVMKRRCSYMLLACFGGLLFDYWHYGIRHAIYNASKVRAPFMRSTKRIGRGY